MLRLWVMFIPSPINEQNDSSSNDGNNFIDPQNVATNNPTKAKPRVMPMLLIDVLYYLTYRTNHLLLYR